MESPVDTRPTQLLYTAQALATGEGRGGHVASDDGILDLDLAFPKELGGGGGATNPEQLFAAGYSACFHSALLGVAKKAGVSIAGSSVTARVGIGPNAQEGFGIAVALTVALPGVDRDTALKLTESAHQVCPYSNATRGNIDVTLHVAEV
jgi:osmotically inducible protein OsmC